jgi:hypothetical protein
VNRGKRAEHGQQNSDNKSRTTKVGKAKIPIFDKMWASKSKKEDRPMFVELKSLSKVRKCSAQGAIL